jgi:hypothetical protein
MSGGSLIDTQRMQTYDGREQKAQDTEAKAKWIAEQKKKQEEMEKKMTETTLLTQKAVEEEMQKREEEERQRREERDKKSVRRRLRNRVSTMSLNTLFRATSIRDNLSIRGSSSIREGFRDGISKMLGRERANR